MNHHTNRNPLTAAETRETMIFVALGSNLGDRARILRSALRQIETTRTGCILACSRMIETDPVGGPPDQPRYLNAVARISSSLEPAELLNRLLEIERAHGRERIGRDHPRTLDLDLLLYGELRIASEPLTLPHPRMWDRPFVLEPLAEVCDSAWLNQMRSAALSSGAPQGS
jgi:2-amino-4-hydroxy-6-hydroxymethyldihydropteridine diphosphokinase